MAPQERIQTIDILRGIALLGILIINFTVDDWDAGLYKGFSGVIDQLFYWPIKLLMDDRFMATYCFLFGLGFAIQMQRAARRGKPFVFAFLRRMIALYLIGTIANIVFKGSVLESYAVTGLLLLLFWKLPTRLLPIVALVCFLTPTTIAIINSIHEQTQNAVVANHPLAIDKKTLDRYVGVYENQEHKVTVVYRDNTILYGQGVHNKIRLYPISQNEFKLENRNLIQVFVTNAQGRVVKFEARNAAHEVLQTWNRTDMPVAAGLKLQDQQRKGVGINKPSYWQFVKNNATEFRQVFPRMFLHWDMMLGTILVLFVLGMYAGKKRIFYDVNGNTPLLKRVFKWGLICGGPAVLMEGGFQAYDFWNNIQIGSYSSFIQTVRDSIWNAGIIPLTLAYIAGITLLLNKEKFRKKLAFLARVGRLGLTNYLLHLAAAMLLFNNVNFPWDLSGNIGCFYRVMVAIPVYCVIYLFSRWWLMHFSIGPVEWLWRSATYLTWQPLRLPKAAAEDSISKKGIRTKRLRTGKVSAD
ncbi:MAG: DUF418 domain-containing protein [Ignavibacteriales bacterium]